MNGNAYAQAGVDYSQIDPTKIDAQLAAATTSGLLSQHGFAEVSASRGESAYVVDVGPFYLASILECLGTKALVADAMAATDGRSRYATIAQDTIAMAVNDLVTVGATPLVVQAYWAAGGSDFFSNQERQGALIEGWRSACVECGVAWGGGETPALAGVVESGRIDLAASCIGVVNPKQRLIIGKALRAGDAVVLIDSSGIHANGVSLARKLVDRFPDGWLTEVEHGVTYGDALLQPTVLYAKLMEALWLRGITPHYCANITGHGWSKLARHPGNFTIRIHRISSVPPVLAAIQRYADLPDAEAYTTLNMGAGFAIFVDPEEAPRVVTAAIRSGYGAHVAGVVEEGERGVILEPLDLRLDPPAIR